MLELLSLTKDLYRKNLQKTACFALNKCNQNYSLQAQSRLGSKGIDDSGLI